MQHYRTCDACSLGREACFCLWNTFLLRLYLEIKWWVFIIWKPCFRHFRQDIFVSDLFIQTWHKISTTLLTKCPLYIIKNNIHCYDTLMGKSWPLLWFEVNFFWSNLPLTKPYLVPHLHVYDTVSIIYVYHIHIVHTTWHNIKHIATVASGIWYQFI